MSRAEQKSSPTDRHAKRIALAIAKGRSPRSDAEFDRYCESSPREIFAAFAGLVRHMPPAGKDKALALGYLFVLQGLLENTPESPTEDRLQRVREAIQKRDVDART